MSDINITLNSNITHKDRNLCISVRMSDIQRITKKEKT